MGRTTESYTVAGCGTTNADPTVTAPAGTFSEEDLFRPISGTNIPASSYIGVVTSDTSIELSSSATVNTPVNATGTSGAVTVTIGAGDPARLGFIGWSPETDAESETYKINSGGTPPDRITVAGGPKTAQRGR